MRYADALAMLTQKSLKPRAMSNKLVVRAAGLSPIMNVSIRDRFHMWQANLEFSNDRLVSIQITCD